MQYNSDNINYIIVYDNGMSINSDCIISRENLDFYVKMLGIDDIYCFGKENVFFEHHINYANVLKFQRTKENVVTRFFFKNCDRALYFSNSFEIYQQKTRQIKLNSILSKLV